MESTTNPAFSEHPSNKYVVIAGMLGTDYKLIFHIFVCRPLDKNSGLKNRVAYRVCLHMSAFDMWLFRSLSDTT